MKCWICQESGSQGIHLHGYLLCERCESRLISASVDDPEYDFFCDKLKALWRNRIERCKPVHP